jgi:hypothetical protein
MGKYFGRLIIVVICVFVLECLGMIEIPYFNIPDLTVVKKEVVQKKNTVYYKIDQSFDSNDNSIK